MFFSGNKSAGIHTGGQKALAEGMSIAVSEGRVHSVEYHPVSKIIGGYMTLSPKKIIIKTSYMGL